MISGSRDDDLYAHQSMERPCYWVSNLNGNIFPCLWNVSLPVCHAQLRQPLSFHFMVSNTASFLLSQSEQSVNLSSSLAHKTFSQPERKLNAFKLPNFGTSKTFYMILFPHSASALHHLSFHCHLFNKFRSIKLNSTHYLLCLSTSPASSGKVHPSGTFWHVWHVWHVWRV